MSAQRLVQGQRVELLRALCCGGTAEGLESILDLLLAWDVLIWEDCQSLRPPGRTLCASARELLDLVSSKGGVACQLLLAAFNQVLPEAQKAGLSFGDCGLLLETAEMYSSTATQTLKCSRPRLVRKLQGCVTEALKALVESGSFTAYDCDEVQLPIYTPSQQARRLLDLVGSKGESTSKVLLQLIQQTEDPPILHKDVTKHPADVLQYQKKLRSSVSAQSHFFSTYGGTGRLSLDDIYTEGLLEVVQLHGETQPTLQLEDILGQVGTLNEEADTVLVSGEAGSGKSTLLQRLHLLWARKAALVDYLFLYPFSCRRLSAEGREMSLRDLLFQHCCWPDGEQDQLFQFILDHPHRVIFTFDGLDEFRISFSDELRHCCPTRPAAVPTLLFNLLQGSLMKGVRKVVTSRPEAVDAVLKRYIRKEVLLKGFSPEGISCFVRKHHRDSSVTTSVLDSLRSNTALFGLCHNPVLCWIVSKCYKELLGSGGLSPQTITDVYLMILHHFLKRHSPQKQLRGSDWLGGHVDTTLHLGRLALDGLESACYVFSDTELHRCKVTEEDISTGFLILSKDLSYSGSKRYEFLHVTMQCFFAALYIVLSDDKDCGPILELFHPQYKRQSSLASVCLGLCLSSHSQQDWNRRGQKPESERPNLQITATFVSGLLSQRHRALLQQSCLAKVLDRKCQQVVKAVSRGMQKHFQSIPRPVKGEKKSMHAMPEFVWLIKCIYEMQDSRMAQATMAKLDVEHLKLTYCNIGPVDCNALAYVLQHLRSPVGLQLDYNSVGDVGVEQLLPSLGICHSLYLRNNNISDEGIRKLIEKVVHYENFQKIALFNNRLTDACMKDFSKLLKTKQNFLSLRLGNNYITAVGAEQLAEGLRGNHSLQFLGLWGNKIGDRGAEALAYALQGSSSLVWLSLVDNEVGSVGAQALAELIKSSSTLEELWLSKNCITMEGVKYLLQAMEMNTTIKSVWLRGNELSQEEVEEITQRDKRLIF